MLYKYLPPDRLDVLKKLKIRFSQPSALNDPFESHPLINIGALCEDQLRNIEITSQELWKNTSKENKTKQNYNLLKTKTKELKADMKEKMSPSSVGQHFIKMFNNSMGVLSLSRTFNNLLMWSHYAHNHKGFVIGFDEKHSFFYQKSVSGLTTSPNDVRYTSQRSQSEVSDPDKYRKLLCEKSIDWAYEEEVRVIMMFTEYSESQGNDESGLPIYLFDIPVDMIKTIYIGSNMIEKDRKEILQFIGKNKLNIQLYKMKISEWNYEKIGRAHV